MTDSAPANRSPRPARPKISAVITIYMDGPAIPIMYERLIETFARIDVDYEIIFVNGASPDESAELLAELAARDERVVVVNHSRSFGSQNSFSSGMRIATGDAVVLMDGDLQDPPEMIEQFHEKWMQGWDVVYGERIKRDTTRFLKFAYKAFYRVFRRASYVQIPLDAGDFSLIDRRVLDVINSLPEKNRFLRGLRAYVGFQQTGVPYVRPERMFGTSTNNMLKNLGWARKAIYSFSYAPLELITVLAFGTVALSGVGAIAQIVIRIVSPESVPAGLTTIILLVLFMGGIQLLCLSIIGGYLAHIYEEVKSRPSYVVESVINAPQRRRSDGSPRAREYEASRIEDQLSARQELDGQVR
jgi:dolichol-phosphate mannosyltransferase